MAKDDWSAEALSDVEVTPAPAAVSRRRRSTADADCLSVLPCPNCGADFRAAGRVPATVYCSGWCATQAKAVRYERGVRARYGSGRIPADVRVALQRKQMFALTPGGYDRPVPVSTRRLVWDRDGGVCQQCGGVATEIHHLAGDSAAPEDLQLSCSRCNQAAADEHVRVAGPESERLAEQLRRRGSAAVPIRPCDEPGWDWRGYVRHHARPLGR